MCCDTSMSHGKDFLGGRTGSSPGFFFLLDGPGRLMGKCIGRCMCKQGQADECLCDPRFTSVKSIPEVEEETSLS